MKKYVLALFFLLGASILKAGNYGTITHTLAPQFRVWKSSALETGSYSGAQISTSPIIFHAVIGSGTFNSGGDSAFTLFQSTGMTSMSSDASTKAIITLDSTSGNNAFGAQLDILITTHSYFNKSGGARVQYLWDYLNYSSFNKYPND